MDNNELRNKTLSGLLWKFAERFGAQGISFVVSIVLARLIMPEEYGVIAIVTVIISLCDVFVNSGLGTALIQKKDADDLDFSTVFFFSFGLSILIYLGLFVGAPFVAAFFEKEILTSVIRVMGARIIVASFNTVQHAYVSRNMQFKKFFFSTLGGTVGSAFVGIGMAYVGFGVWALVGQYLSNAIADTIILFCTIAWKPKLKYSWERWKALFSYSWMLLVSSLIDTFYNNLRNLIIGKQYSAADLAYYDKGKQLPDLLSTNILSSIESVLFPAIAAKQDEKSTVKAMVRRFIKTGSYLMMPLMIGLAVAAEPLVNLLLTEKWLFCVPYIQIYCVVGFLQPIQTANQQAIKALGRSDITLKLEVAKKSLGVVILLCAMPYGVFAIAASNILYSCVVLLMNSFPNIRLLDYSLLEQLKDILKNLVISLLMGAVVYCVSFLILPSWAVLLIQIIVGFTVYAALSVATKNESFEYVVAVVGQLLHAK